MNYRISSDKIWKNAIAFKLHGRYFYYDYSIGTILELTQNIFETIERYGIESKESAVLSLLKEMRNSFSSTNQDDLSFISQDYVAYLSFAPTHECNLSCSYCYGGQGKNYIGDTRGFDEKSIRSMIDSFVDVIYPDAAVYRIDFVGGGEPLLNFSAVKHTIDYIERLAEEKGKTITVWLCTNGTLITDEIAEYLVNHKVPIGISLDGNRDKHNKYRPYKNGHGSFDAVLDGLKTYRKIEQNSLKSNLWALCTATNDNCDFTNIICAFKELGFKNAQIRLIRSKESYDVDKVIQEYDRLYNFLLREYKCGNIETLLMIVNDNDQFGKILKRVMLNQLTPIRCLAGWRRITVCPNGSVYPCDSFVGKENYCMGNIDNIEPVPFKNSINCWNKQIFECAHCDVRLICGGDCFYNALEKTGSPHIPDSEYCEIQKHLVMNAVALCCDMSNENERLYDELVRKVEIKDAYTSIRG